MAAIYSYLSVRPLDNFKTFEIIRDVLYGLWILVDLVDKIKGKLRTACFSFFLKLDYSYLKIPTNVDLKILNRISLTHLLKKTGDL